jgi:kinesin family protein 4/21/27
MTEINKQGFFNDLTA